jgi:hypothetical protein
MRQIPVFPALGREAEAGRSRVHCILSYTVSSRPAWNIVRPCLKKRKKVTLRFNIGPFLLPENQKAD